MATHAASHESPPAIRPVECFKEGWELIKPVYWMFFVVTLIAMILGSMTFGLLTGPLVVGAFLCLIKRERGESFEIGDVFKGFDHFVDALVAFLMILAVGIVVGVGVLIIGAVLGTLTVAVPGEALKTLWGVLVGLLIWLLYTVLSLALIAAFQFVFPLLADQKLKGVQAVKESVVTARGNAKGLVLLALLEMLALTVSSLVCLIGTYFMVPVLLATSFVAYRKLFPVEGAAAAEAPVAPEAPAPAETAPPAPQQFTPPAEQQSAPAQPTEETSDDASAASDQPT